MTRLQLGLWPAALAGVLLLAGCPPAESPISLDDPVARPGTTKPDTTSNTGPVSGSPGTTTQSNPGEVYPLGGSRILVRVRDDGGAPVAGAQISVVGPGLGFGVSGATGDAEIGPLPLGTFEVRVQAEGKAVFTGSVQLAAPRTRADITAHLALASRTLAGHVQDGAGKAIPCARVALGKAWTVTDAAGDYSLSASEAGDATVVKTGYQPAATGGGSVALAGAATKVSFENDPLGTAAGTAFSKLRDAIGQMGWTAVDRDPGAQIRVWAAPAGVSDAQAQDAATFVAGGGKLIVLAEWGGASGYSPAAANRLLLPLGVQVASDLIRVPSSTLGRPEWFSPVVAQGTPAAQGAPAVALLGAASVQAAAPSMRMLSVPADGYRVQATADAGPAVGAVRQIATGLAVVLGDTSAWLDADIGRQDNLNFIRNMLAW